MNVNDKKADDTIGEAEEKKDNIGQEEVTTKSQRGRTAQKKITPQVEDKASSKDDATSGKAMETNEYNLYTKAKQRT